MAVFERSRTKRGHDNPPEPVDSRNYIVPFAITTVEAIPQDFPSFVPPDFHRGVFLPRHDPDRFGRSTYPPRILLLTDSTLVLLTHPRNGAPPVEIRLSDIGSLETANMLLLGWTEIGVARTSNRVEYNTRYFQPIGEFLQELRRLVFPPGEVPCLPAAHFGDEFEDVKFSRAGDSELDPGESVLLSFLSLPTRRMRRRRLTSREIWEPGDLVVCTDRRLTWITDRYKGLCERYGRVVRSARLRDVRGILARRSDQGAILSVQLQDCEWAIPLSHELATSATSFADALASRFNPWC